MKVLIVLAICFNSLFCSSQDAINLECVKMYNTTIIKPTWDNLLNLLFLDQKGFEKTMAKYSYSLTTDRQSFIAGTGAGDPYYTVKRSSSDIYIYSEKDNSFVQDFRKQVASKLSSPTASFSGGFETYYATLTRGGIKYNIEIAFKSTSSGGSMIGIFLK